MIDTNSYNLWAKVIDQAKSDLLADPHRYIKKFTQQEVKRNRDDVIQWLGTEDFKQVCQFAGTDHQKIMAEFELIRRSINE